MEIELSRVLAQNAELQTEGFPSANVSVTHKTGIEISPPARFGLE